MNLGWRQRCQVVCDNDVGRRRDDICGRDALPRSALAWSERNFDGNVSNLRCEWNDRDSLANFVGLVSRHEHGWPAAYGCREVDPPDLVAPHAQSTDCNTAAAARERFSFHAFRLPPVALFVGADGPRLAPLHEIQGNRLLNDAAAWARAPSYGLP